MSVRIRKAAGSEAKPLVGIYSESGRGKTKSSLLLANGFVGGDMSRVVMIETESGRGEAYANDPVVGGYSVISLRESFSPKEYGAAIAEAERAKVEALIVDSGSHEWEGIGGVLAMAAANEEAGRKGPLVWQKPKIDHQREFIARLLQTPIPLVVVCLRAKFPMYQIAQKHVEIWEQAGRPGGDKGRPKIGEWARASQVEPKQSEDFLYECFVHGWIDEAHRFHVTKLTLDELGDVFRDGEPITVGTGKRLAAWARRTQGAKPDGESISVTDAKPGEELEMISPDQKRILESTAREYGIEIERLLAKAKVGTLNELPANDYESALAWVHRHAKGSPRASP